MELEHAYAVLGASPDQPLGEIKARYLTRADLMRPHATMSEDAAAEAQVLLDNLTAAWNVILEHRAGQLDERPADTPDSESRFPEDEEDEDDETPEQAQLTALIFSYLRRRPASWITIPTQAALLAIPCWFVTTAAVSYLCRILKEPIPWGDGSLEALLAWPDHHWATYTIASIVLFVPLLVGTWFYYQRARFDERVERAVIADARGAESQATTLTQLRGARQVDLGLWPFILPVSYTLVTFGLMIFVGVMDSGISIVFALRAIPLRVMLVSAFAAGVVLALLALAASMRHSQTLRAVCALLSVATIVATAAAASIVAIEAVPEARAHYTLKALAQSDLEPGEPKPTDAEAHCFADRLLDGIGRNGLEAYDILKPNGERTETDPKDVWFSEPDANVVATAVIDCIPAQLDWARDQAFDQYESEVSGPTYDCMRKAITREVFIALTSANLSHDETAAAPVLTEMRTAVRSCSNQ